jgi:hypothetical protein
MPQLDERAFSCLLIGAMAALVMTVAATSRPVHVPGPASPARLHELYDTNVAKEPSERQDSARSFRGSPWSQDDDFHGKETNRVKDFAKVHDVSISSLLDGIDTGMREKWATPSNNVPRPTVMPCRPRLTY